MAAEPIRTPKAQQWALWAALAFYAVFIVIYFFQGDIPFLSVRAQAEKWGQFGDYVGGVVNPVVGLITIWLLTASLKQSQREMELTRKALIDAETSQKATEAALREQIAVSEQARDMNNTIALWQNALAEYNKSLIDVKNATSPDAKARAQKWLTVHAANKIQLGKILEKEAERLFSKYLPSDESH